MRTGTALNRACFSLTHTAPTAIYTLSLHDALPICSGDAVRAKALRAVGVLAHEQGEAERARDRKSTRLNSSHVAISYAVFCLKKKKITLVAIETSERCIPSTFESRPLFISSTIFST